MTASATTAPANSWGARAAATPGSSARAAAVIFASLGSHSSTSLRNRVRAT